MKGKEWIYRFLIFVGVSLLIGFALSVGRDYQYRHINSAPFYYIVIAYAIEYLLPAIVLLVTGVILRKKVKRGEV